MTELEDELALELAEIKASRERDLLELESLEMAHSKNVNENETEKDRIKK